MQKVVIITNIMSPYRIDLFNQLESLKKFNITVIYSAQSDDREWKIENINHKYEVLNSKTIKLKKMMDYKYIHIPTDIIKKLNIINPDIIVASEYNPTSILSYIWCKNKHKKFISWSDGTLNSEKNINFLQKILRKIICSKSDALIASSTKTKEAQIKYGAKSKIFISYLTIDVNKYMIDKYNWKNNNNILYVGSLIERKGLDLLFKAIKNVKDDFTLNIVGSGEKIEELQELSKRLGINEKVNFLGFKQREELIELYKNSDIFVLPTREDCFGLVINEAMCAGLPIIASKYADGSYDLIEENKGGYIIDPYNVSEFLNKIEILLEDEKKREKMGKFNQEKIKEFSIEKVVIPYIEAIDYVLK